MSQKLCFINVGDLGEPVHLTAGGEPIEHIRHGDFAHFETALTPSPLRVVAEGSRSHRHFDLV